MKTTPTGAPVVEVAGETIVCTKLTAKPYEHPKTIASFEEVYRREYENELADSDRWIAWCKEQNDHYGVNFHQGKRSATVFNNIKMEQLLRILKGEAPNA
jgi:hypothetical protein